MSRSKKDKKAGGSSTQICYDKQILHRFIKAHCDLYQHCADYLFYCYIHILIPSNFTSVRTVEDAEDIYEFPPEVKPGEEFRKEVLELLSLFNDPDYVLDEEKEDEKLFQFYTGGLSMINQVKVNDSPESSFPQMQEYFVNVRDLYRIHLDHDFF